MECEEAIIDEKTADIINKAADENRRICAVGTTTMRALETSVSSNKKISAYQGWTNKFIYPPYDFGYKCYDYQFPHAKIYINYDDCSFCRNRFYHARL